jgi:antitoxin HicB
MEYTIILEPNEENSGYTVLVPALPGCVTQGGTRDEAIMRAKEAIEAYVESLRKDGEPVPEETQPIEVLKVAV